MTGCMVRFWVLRGCWLYLATSALCLLAVDYLAGGSLVFLLWVVSFWLLIAGFGGLISLVVVIICCFGVGC